MMFRKTKDGKILKHATITKFLYLKIRLKIGSYFLFNLKNNIIYQLYLV